MQVRRAFVALLAAVLIGAAAPLLPSAPITPAGATGGSPFFEDRFDGTSLTSNWNTSIDTAGNRWCASSAENHSTGSGEWTAPGALCHGLAVPSSHGTISVAGGMASFGAGTNRTFPYIWRGGPSKPSPFPSSGDFSLDVRLRYDVLTGHGSGFVANKWPNTDPSGNNPYGQGHVFGIWADSATSSRVCLTDAGCTTVANATSFHEYRLDYVGGEYTIYVDGARRLGPLASSVRPNNIWIGNAVFTQWDLLDWTDFTVDSVIVSDDPPPVGGDVTAESKRGGGSPSQDHVCPPQAADPCDTSTGNFFETFTDLVVPGRGMPLAFRRTYNSYPAPAIPPDGPLGYGWSFNYGLSLAIAGDLSSVTVNEENGAQVTFTLSGGAYAAPPRVLAALVRNADGSWTFTRRARAIYRFDSSGRLTAQEDRNGYTTSLAYNGSGQLASVTDPAGRTLTLGWSGNHITSVTDTASPARSVSFSYDGSGNLTEVIDVGGGHWTFGYDANHRMTTKRTPKYFGDTTTTPSPVVTNHYDASGRVDWQSDQLGRTTNFDYTSIANSTKITDPDGNVRVDTFTYGLLTSRTLGYGTAQAASWAYAYDPATLGRTSITDPNGGVSSATFDSFGNQLTATDPLGRTTTATYNGLNEPLTVTDAAGVTTTFTYDGAGNLLSTSTPLVGSSPAVSRTTSYAYGDAAHPGDITAVTDPRGKVWSASYDAHGNLGSSTDPLGNVTRLCYDPVGRRTKVIAPKGSAAGVTCATASPTFTTTITLDAFGAPLTITDPLGKVTTRVYDPNQQLVSLTDPNGNVTGYDYDPADQLISLDRADGTTLGYGYDDAGAQSSQTDGAGRVTSYAHDHPAFPGLVTASTDPLGRTTSFGYDPLGRQVTKQDPGGNCAATPKVGCTTISYDTASQLTGIDYSDPATPDVTWAYDAVGRRTSMVDGTGTTSYAWDSLGRFTSSTDGAGTTVGYAYDLAGHVTSIAYPGARAGTMTKGYDDAGRLSSVTDWLGNTTSYGYDADSNLTSQAYPNGKTATITSDAADQLTDISHAPTSAPSSPFASFSYGRDNNGQVTSVTSSGVPADDHSYSYSQLNQLRNIDTAATAYGYDAADNLVRLADGNAQYFDAANQLTSSAPAISLVGTGSAGDAGTATSITVTLPAGIAANDQILLSMTTQNDLTVTTPAGYTLVGSYPAGTSGKTMVYRRTAAGGETSVTLSTSGLRQKSIVAAIYRGVDPTSPIDASSAGSAANATSVTAPSLTTTADNDRLVLLEGCNGNAIPVSWNAPAGMTNRVQKSNLPLSSAALADQTLGAAGATGIRTATETSTPSTLCDLSAVLVALKPAATSYGYDSRGNRTSITPPVGPATTLAYDQANRLTAYGPSATYGYNGDGLRMTKTVTGATTPFAWNTAEGLPLLIGDGTTSYLYGPGGQPLEQITPLDISLVGTASGGDAGTSTSATVTLPSGIVANDQILLAITTQSDLTVTTPAGYTIVGAYLAGANSKTIIYRRTATGGETSVTLSTSGLRQKSIVAAVYRGVDPTNPIDVSSSAAAVGVTSVTAPSLTTTAVNDRLVLFQGANGNALPVAWNAPAGMTNRVQKSNLPLSSAAIADQPLAGPGASGARIASTSSTPSSLADLTAVLIALRPDQVVLYYHQDQLGSTRALTDRAGAVVATNTYDPYGNLTASTGSVTTPFGYAGQYTDNESGLLYLRARYYDAGTGTFLSRDPLEPITGTPYAYGNNDPLNTTDPSGLWGIRLGPIKVGNDGCMLGTNPNGSCRGSNEVQFVKDYSDDASAYLAGVAVACAPFAWTGVGAACAGLASAGSTTMSAFHTAAECLSDGILQSGCGWSAAQTALAIGTAGASNAVRGLGTGRGPILRGITGFGARTVDFYGNLTNLGLSLHQTGWYDQKNC